MNGLFSMRSAYHLIIKERSTNDGEPSQPDAQLWKSIWSLKVPPRIKLFIWRFCKGIIPSKGNIGINIPGFNMQCMVSLSPLAEGRWEDSEFSPALWTLKFRTPADCFGATKICLIDDEMGKLSWFCGRFGMPGIYSSSKHPIETLMC